MVAVVLATVAVGVVVSIAVVVLRHSSLAIANATREEVHHLKSIVYKTAVDSASNCHL